MTQHRDTAGPNAQFPEGRPLGPDQIPVPEQAQARGDAQRDRRIAEEQAQLRDQSRSHPVAGHDFLREWQERTGQARRR